MPQVPPSGRNGERADRGHADGIRDELARLSAVVSQMVVRLPPEWRTRRRWIAVGAVLLGVLAIYFVTRPAPAPAPQQVPADTKVFQISNTPVLTFAHSSGRVHITSGPDGQVSIKENRNGITSAIQTQYTRTGDKITVAVSIPDGLYLDTWVDFDVTVPKRAGVTAMLAAGTLEANGLNGHITLSDTNGAIWATNLSGSIALTTQSGSINTERVSGQLTAITQNGTITTGTTRLSGRSTMQADSGTINFHGSLDPSGSYLFRNSNGAIGLTLPNNSAVNVDAHSMSGSITSAFPTVAAVRESSGSGARGSFGRAPRARLTIQTTSGSIQLFQGG